MRAVGRARAAAAVVPLRLAYADPPYPGKAWLYRDPVEGVYGDPVRLQQERVNFSLVARSVQA